MPSTTAVRDVMTTDVVTLRPDQTFAEAADLLADKRIGAAPVVDASGKLVGLLRDEDLIVSEANLHAPTVAQLLRRRVPGPRCTEALRGRAQAHGRGQRRASSWTTEFETASPDDTLGRRRHARCTTPTSPTCPSSTPTGSSSASSPAATSSAASPRPPDARGARSMLRHVWCEVDLDAVRAQHPRARRDRPAGRAARRGQGRRLRPRRGADGACCARRGSDVARGRARRGGCGAPLRGHRGADPRAVGARRRRRDRGRHP